MEADWVLYKFFHMREGAPEMQRPFPLPESWLREK